MATSIGPNAASGSGNAGHVSATVEELLLAALERGDNSLQTGRYLMTFKKDATEQAVQYLGASQGMRVADARDFSAQAVTPESVGDADSVVLPEIGVALVSGPAAQERNLHVASVEAITDTPIASVDPEYFQFAIGVLEELAAVTPETGSQSGDYLRGFMRAAELFAKALQDGNGLPETLAAPQLPIQAQGATWGLNACKVPPSARSGLGIKVAVLDTGFDLGHPDFAGRPIVSETFVGQPVQDLHGHGTHTTGTACGPKAPSGSNPRYGIGFASSIFSGKVLTNSGTGTMAGILAGINWAIANRCAIISMSLGGQIAVQPSYTAAGQSALNAGCLIIAAAGNASSQTGAPANSPTVLSVASLDNNLAPSSFSDFSKIDIAGPGRDVFSSWPRPKLYNIISGTSMATPHVSGCAALWAETDPNLRGQALWTKLVQTARPLPYPPDKVGAGLVQAP